MPKLNNQLAALLIVVASVGCGVVTAPQDGGNGDVVNNGGDPMRILTVQGKGTAPDMVLSFSSDYLTPAWEPEVQAWLNANKDQLADDIKNSNHSWTNNYQETCAETKKTPKADIILYWEACRESIPYLEQAIRLLIHESTHHFGIDDETFCDKVAIAVVTSWRKAGNTIDGGFKGSERDPPNATILVNGGRNVVNTLEVSLEVTATASTDYIKFSESRDFLDAQMVKVQHLHTYKFDSPGPKIIYFQVSNDHGLQSSTFSLRFVVDLFATEDQLFKPDFRLQNPQIVAGTRLVRLVGIKVPQIATGMMIAVDQIDFAGAAPWQAVSPEADFQLPDASAGCGEHTIYLKFRTTEGFESAIGTQKLAITCN